MRRTLIHLPPATGIAPYMSRVRDNLVLALRNGKQTPGD